MRTIGLSNTDEVVLVDDGDYDHLLSYTWYLERGGVRTRIKERTRSMASVIMGICTDRVTMIDHADRNVLNNRRENLRPCTSSQNAMNAGKSPTYCGEPTSSRFKGVCWHRTGRKWQASIQCQGRRYHLGHFETEADAARAYDQKAHELFGGFSRTNF